MIRFLEIIGVKKRGAGKKHGDGSLLLTREQAVLIIEREIKHRGWDEYDSRGYQLVKIRGKLFWHCQGVVSHRMGGVMNTRIDAKTGEIVSSKAGGR